MNFPKLQIGNLVADIPIVQGGMGVKVSLASLASAVANEGGIGTISSIGLGDVDVSAKYYEDVSREALVEALREEMLIYAASLDFEKAARIRDRIAEICSQAGISDRPAKKRARKKKPRGR